MSDRPSPEGWGRRVFSAVVLVLAVAVGARVAAELLAPLLPVLAVAAGLMVIYYVIWGRRA